jgi:hypothetical protein
LQSRDTPHAAERSWVDARRAPLLIAAAVAIAGSAAAVRYHQLGLSLAHYDARAHLVVARRVFDSLTPGWQQVGAVWLPLPHLLNALPVQHDWLYRTGYSAIAISIASMAIAAWAIARLIQRATGSIAGGVVAAALLMLNPDVLYLQSTPMTEPLLFGTTFLAVALIAEWCGAVRPPAPAGSRANAGQTAAPPSTRAAGWACIAAIMTRYEAFPIVAAAIGLAFVMLVRRGWRVVPALRAVRGLALWPLWALAAFVVNSKVSVGAFFVSSGFFVAENPALGHPWTAWMQVWDGLVRLDGPLIPWLAALSVAALVASAFRRKHPFHFMRKHHSPFSRKLHPDFRPKLPEAPGASDLPPDGDAVLVVLALAACAALPLYAYFKGHPVRVRYDVPLVAASAAMIGAAIALLPRRLQAFAGAAVIVLAAWQVHPLDPTAPVVVESQREAPDMEGRRAVTAYLSAHWDGAPILMSMGSLGHYMHDLALAGFDVRDFLHEGNGEIWKYAVAHPAPVAEWIAIEERAEGGDALHWQALNDAAFLRGFERVAEGGGVSLYRRTGARK